MLVTVVTPSLNGIEFLPECVESVKRQSSPTLEVEHIFVDGGSTDGTPEYAREHGATVLTREENNVSYAVSKGMRNASGTLIGVLGCDDMLLDGALQALVTRYEADGLPWLAGGCRWIDGHGRVLGDQPAPPVRLPVPMLASLHYNPFSALATYFHRDFAYELGCYDVDYYYSADFDLFMRARQRSEFSRLSRPLAVWRRHGGNTSLEHNSEHTGELRMIVDRYGPRQQWQRELYRGAMRSWMNLANPSWFVKKRFNARRERAAAA